MCFCSLKNQGMPEISSAFLDYKPYLIKKCLRLARHSLIIAIVEIESCLLGMQICFAIAAKIRKCLRLALHSLIMDLVVFPCFQKSRND